MTKEKKKLKKKQTKAMTEEKKNNKTKWLNFKAKNLFQLCF